MEMLMLFAFVLLAGLLIMTGVRYGVPCMVSDIYYQMGGRDAYGWVFSLTMGFVALFALAAMLDSEWGADCLAFIGCGGLAFVAVAPNYADENACPVHKGGAIVAAVGCVGWCLSACWWVTLVVGAAYLVYLASAETRRLLGSVWWMRGLTGQPRSWYWAEVAAFADVFLTYGACFVKNLL